LSDSEPWQPAGARGLIAQDRLTVGANVPAAANRLAASRSAITANQWSSLTSVAYLRLSFERSRLNTQIAPQFTEGVIPQRSRNLPLARLVCCQEAISPVSRALNMLGRKVRVPPFGIDGSGARAEGKRTLAVLEGEIQRHSWTT